MTTPDECLSSHCPRPEVPLVGVEDVTFVYGNPDDAPGDAGRRSTEPPALDSVSFEVGAGTLTLLCGPSGCGKSTALRLLNGLVPHFHPGHLQGRVRVAGIDVSHTDLTEAGRTSATVFQNPRTQFFTSEVRAELAFRAENYGADPHSILADIEEAAARVGITELLPRRITQLSGGELQKVACAQALAADTPVLLFDEPTSNLSPSAVGEFGALLAQLRRSGHTIVVAEHRLSFLRGITDQVVLMDRGHIRATFTGEEFFALDDADRRSLGLRCLRPRPDVVTAGVPRPHQGAPGSEADRTPTAGPRPAGVELRGVRYSYGSRRVLDIEDLSLPAGTVSVLVGANGAGKTTLARVLCGLATPERGSRILLDSRPTSTRQRLACTSIVMQDVHRQLFCESVEEEVRLGAAPHGGVPVDAPAVLARLDLAETARRHPLSLSGGQKQRLVIGAAVAAGKRVLIFDEPTSGVDLRHMETIAALLRELADSGAVVLVITHDAELIEACADRVITLSPLEEVRGGTPQVRLHEVQSSAPQGPTCASTSTATSTPTTQTAASQIRRSA